MLIPAEKNTKTITDLRENTNTFIDQVKKSDQPTFVFKGSHPQIVALSLSYYQKLLDMLEDWEDAALASELISKPEKGGKTLEEVAKELGIKL